MWQTCRKYTPTNFKALQRKAAARHIQNSALSSLSLSSKTWNNSELTKKRLWAYDCPIFRLVVSNQKEEPHKSKGTTRNFNWPKAAQSYYIHAIALRLRLQIAIATSSRRMKAILHLSNLSRAYRQPLAYRWRMTLSTIADYIYSQSINRSKGAALTTVAWSFSTVRLMARL